MLADTKVQNSLMVKSLQGLFLNSKPLPFATKQSFSETLFETIAIRNLEIQNLKYHQRRVDSTFRDYFRKTITVNLAHIINNYLQTVSIKKESIYRLKITYNSTGVINIEHSLYNKKVINNFLLLEIPNLEYPFKYSNRECFDALQKNFKADEFIIVKNGYITDTTIANIALYHQKLKIWHTPKNTLLNGTTRERLLENKRISIRDIHYCDLENYSKIALLNAMIGFDTVNERG